MQRERKFAIDSNVPNCDTGLAGKKLSSSRRRAEGVAGGRRGGVEGHKGWVVVGGAGSGRPGLKPTPQKIITYKLIKCVASSPRGSFCVFKDMPSWVW